MSRRRLLPYLGLAVVLAATALAYWPGTGSGFIFDDYPNIVENPAMKIHRLTPGMLLRAAYSMPAVGVLDRPVAMASFALNDYFSGMRARPMKITNLAIHLLNGVLIFLLLRLLLGEYARLKEPGFEAKRTGTGSVPLPARVEWTALALAAAWLLAPINLTAVLYTVQRMTSLAATFTLLALILFVAGRRRLFERRQQLGGAVLLLIAALVFTPLSVLTKESGALTMLYALVIEWVFFGFRNISRRVSWTVVGYFALFLLVPLALGLAWLLPGTLSPNAWAARGFTLGERLLTEGRVIWHYVYWTLVPNIHSMTLYHDAFPVSRGFFSPWTTIPAWAGIAALAAAGFACVRRLPLVALGILWFLAGQALTAGFFPLELVFEHREYLPSLGLFLAILGPLLLARPAAKLRAARIGAVVAIVALYGAGLALRSMNWSNPLLHTAIDARAHPDSPRATYAYARTLLILSGHDPALAPAARKALEVANRVPGQGIIALSGLALLAHEQHQPMHLAWFRAMADRLTARPPTTQDISGLNALVRCATRDKNPCVFPSGAMTTVFAAALRHPVPNSYVMAIYGNYLLNALGRPKEAAEVFKLLLKRSPRSPGYHFSLGVCLAASGDGAGARRELAELRRLNRFGMSDPDISELSQLIDRLYPAAESRKP